MKRAALFLLFAAAAACTVGVAAPVASPPSSAIAAGVSVSGIDLGGLTSEPARARLRQAAARRLTLEYRGRRWRVGAADLEATTSVDDAVARALAAGGGERLTVGVRVPQLAVRRYVSKLARTLDRPARNAHYDGLVEGKPFIAAEQVGVSVRRAATAAAIVDAFNRAARPVVAIDVRRITPAVTRAGFGPIVVIDRGANTLRLYRGMTPVRTFRVATGQPWYPTPSGSWRIVDKQRYPWWYPPASDWAKGLYPVPPGPGNPLGTRWMGLSAPAVGIHGTPDAASIGYSASHGCIRMNVWEAEWLFEQVRLGTRVEIV